MSRGPSPSFLMNTAGNGSSTSLSSPSSNITTPTNHPRSTLRVNTDPTLTRFRSNSAQSHSTTPPGASLMSNGKHNPSTQNTHHPSRSLSHAQLSPIYSNGSGSSTGVGSSSMLERERRPPVSVKVSTSSSSLSLLSPPIVGMPALTRIQKALEHSTDEGDTLDLSRQGVDKIGEEDVDMFRRGVGKDKKGVWR